LIDKRTRRKIVDSIAQSDNDWLLNIQRKLYRWSKQNPAEPYKDLWNWIIDLRNLRLAFRRVATNKGRNTAGVDGITIVGIQNGKGEEAFLKEIHDLLKRGTYQPSPVRRKWIPKPGKPGKLRGLGIPTIQDRIVQSAIKQIIEPIFEARFYHVSYGFRPTRAVRDAIAHLRAVMVEQRRKKQEKKNKPPYLWVIEGDIRACFDQIDHHKLIDRLRQHVVDQKVIRGIRAFLKAGIMEEANHFLPTSTGTPQGGILSPLLANVALGQIEQRYQRWIWPKNLAAGHRSYDRKCNRPIFYPIRYADDFVILCSGNEANAIEEKQKLATFIKEELGLELSDEKTKVSSLEQGFHFLGHHLKLVRDDKWGLHPMALIPKDRLARLRQRVKKLTRRNATNRCLKQLIQKLNPILRGWGNFYQHASRPKRDFGRIDHFVHERIYYWLRNKYPRHNARALYHRFYKRAGQNNWLKWADEQLGIFLLSEIPTARWDLRKRRLPCYAFTVGEPGT
jgi:RNA-directed DNA polymerase